MSPPSTKTSSKIRLNKFLADHGVASRRKADQMIDEGRVTINGKKVFELGIKVDPKTDKVKVGGKLILNRPQPQYFVFNKPKKVVTTTEDPEGRPVVLDYFRKVKTRIFPVGRLDWDTEGLLILTNDGDFSNAVANPKSKISKTYHAKLDGTPTAEKLNKLTRGISIVGGRVKALEAILLKKGSGKNAWVQIKVNEGKNRQVRRMFEKIGFDVLKLKRVAIGRMKLAGLKIGEYRKLSPEDMENIFKKDTTPQCKKRTVQRKTSSKRLL